MSNTLIIIIGFSIIFLATTLGSATVFIFKKDIPEKLNTLFLGFAAGVMIAASIWSLLIPAIEQSASLGNLRVLPAIVGFIVGGLFIVLIDALIPHIHKGTDTEEGPKNNLKKSIKLFLAMTIHNIPEGLAVGFAFSGAKLVGSNEAYLSALGLAVGIAIQNFPEGASVALPLKKESGNSGKAFLFGMGSGAVEPIAALLGFLLATQISQLQPWLLSFAAGAMIFVVAEDLIPDAKLGSNSHIGSWGVMAGFAIMMALEVLLG